MIGSDSIVMIMSDYTIMIGSDYIIMAMSDCTAVIGSDCTMITSEWAVLIGSDCPIMIGSDCFEAVWLKIGLQGSSAVLKHFSPGFSFALFFYDVILNLSIMNHVQPEAVRRTRPSQKTQCQEALTSTPLPVIMFTLW